MTWLRWLAAGLAAAFGLGAVAQASPLATIKERGRIIVCANPNALPFAAKDGPRRGIELELAEALADQLGVGLEVGWVIFPYHVSRVDCDIILDSIADAEVQTARHVRLSRPYQRSGVILATRPGLPTVSGISGLAGLRVAAMVGSVAQVYLGRQGISTIPYTFEDEMVAAAGSGEVDGAIVSPASVGFYNLTHAQSALGVAPIFDGVPDLNWSVAVGMRKADDALVDSINAALDKLMADGTVARIYASYGIEHRAPAQ
ncbi:MAG: transporter substrate-binding domain-containing protein [Rhodospirillaceae bacterium]|nr:transporter substrate-binding domain-containing protein [Rhodospirillaceae bacterium]